jgi:hypothetical protein
MIQISLYQSHVPYLSMNIDKINIFLPFRHTLELFTKSLNPEFELWSFDGMDENEFPSELRVINDWEFVLALDREYNHGTMICCMNELIHGNILSIKNKKNYRPYNTELMNISVQINNNGPKLLSDINKQLKNIKDNFPNRCTDYENVQIQPEGRIPIYTMNCAKYKHDIYNDFSRHLNI